MAVESKFDPKDMVSDQNAPAALQQPLLAVYQHFYTVLNLVPQIFRHLGPSGLKVSSESSSRTRVDFITDVSQSSVSVVGSR